MALVALLLLGGFTACKKAREVEELQTPLAGKWKVTQVFGVPVSSPNFTEELFTKAQGKKGYSAFYGTKTDTTVIFTIGTADGESTIEAKGAYKKSEKFYTISFEKQVGYPQDAAFSSLFAGKLTANNMIISSPDAKNLQLVFEATSEKIRTSLWLMLHYARNNGYSDAVALKDIQYDPFDSLPFLFEKVE